MWNFVFFGRRQITDACLFVLFFFFPRGDRIDPMVLESYVRAHSNGNENVLVPFFSYRKNGRASRPPPKLIILPNLPDQNSEIAILFSVVEKPYNYVFGDGLLPHSSRGRGYKLQTLTSAYIVIVIWKCTDVFRGIFGLGGGVEKSGIC